MASFRTVVHKSCNALHLNCLGDLILGFPLPLKKNLLGLRCHPRQIRNATVCVEIMN